MSPKSLVLAKTKYADSLNTCRGPMPATLLTPSPCHASVISAPGMKSRYAPRCSWRVCWMVFHVTPRCTPAASCFLATPGSVLLRPGGSDV
jgi:hypothetical protein